MLQHRLLAALLAGLELQLSAQHVDHGAQIDHPSHRVCLTEQRAAVPRGGRHGLGGRDGEACRNPGALIHRGGLPQVTGEAGDDLQEIVGDLRGEVGLLADDAHLRFEFARIVGADFRAEAILEGGDDAAAVGVVLRVGAGDDEDVQGQAQGVSTDLDVAFLHDVEHGDLDALGEIGQFVDRDDAAVCTRDQPEGDGLGITEGAPFGDLDRVDVADEIGDAGVGRGQLLGVALAAVAPLHR